MDIRAPFHVMVTQHPSRTNGQDRATDERVATARTWTIAERIADRLRSKGLSAWVQGNG